MEVGDSGEQLVQQSLIKLIRMIKPAPSGA